MSKFALLFVLVYLSGIISAVVTGPVWGFYLYELVYFLNPGNRWWGNDLPRFSYSFVVVVVMMRTGWRISRKEGIFLVLINLVRWVADFAG